MTGARKAIFDPDCHAPWAESGKVGHRVYKTRREEVARVCLNCTEEKCRKVTGCEKYREALRNLTGKGGKND